MSEETRQHIVEACFETLREEGFTGTTARSIARRGGFNSALIFYYFGTLDALLLAVLDHSSGLRMQRYSAAVAQAHTPEELAQVAADIYGEDLERGYITVFSELVGASLARPELGEEIVRRSEPWIDLVESAVRKALAGSPLAALAPPRDLARLVITLYLGINLFSRMDPDGSGMESLFGLAAQAAPLLSALSGPDRLRGS